MVTLFTRIFGAPPLRHRQSIDTAQLAEIQRHLIETLDGCEGVRADRLRFYIDNAKTAAALWALRSDLHQCIAQTHTESVAAVRINRLSPVFAGWVPTKQRNKIVIGFNPSKK